ncbi:MAG: dCTP deaminase [Thermoplasmatales archaeon]|nr:dCTP deaminase [Thermoplasmatales archaeon]
MGILSDRDIVESMMTGHIGITGFDRKSLTPNGYDLRIAEIKILGRDGIHKEGMVSVPPRTMFYVSTMEAVRMGNCFCAELWLRTTWIRKGVIGAFGKVDAGFNGTLTLGAYNASDSAVEIPVGERFCQMIIESLQSPAGKGYSERSGNYQNQNGVTLEPKK